MRYPSSIQRATDMHAKVALVQSLVSYQATPTFVIAPPSGNQICIIYQLTCVPYDIARAYPLMLGNVNIYIVVATP